MVKFWLCRLDHMGCKNKDDIALEVMIPKKACVLPSQILKRNTKSKHSKSNRLSLNCLETINMHEI